MPTALRTLPDLLRPGLTVVSIGINPSLASVKRGFYFANPRNRFWTALNESGIVPIKLTPSAASVKRLFEEHRIGFTDLVKRPTSQAKALSTAEFQAGAQSLQTKLVANAPAFAWFHGKTALAHFLAATQDLRSPLAWGMQRVLIGETHVYLSPNPSPANAAFSIGALIANYREFAALVHR